MGNVFAWVNEDGKAVGYSTLRSDDDQIEMPESEAMESLNDLSLVEYKVKKLQEINQHFVDTTDLLTGPYPFAERQTWFKQEAEAIAHKANNSAHTPLLDSLCVGRNLTKPELALRVRKKAAAFTVGSGLAIGERQRCEDMVNIATTKALVDAVLYTLPDTFWTDIQTAYANET